MISEESLVQIENERMLLTFSMQIHRTGKKCEQIAYSCQICRYTQDTC